MMIDSRIVGDIYFLDCRGKITAGENAMAVRTTVGGILKDGGKKIVLNLADIVLIPTLNCIEERHYFQNRLTDLDLLSDYLGLR